MSPTRLVLFALAVAVLQVVLVLFARALRRPLRLAPILAGQALVWALVAWGAGPWLLVPTSFLATQVPLPPGSDEAVDPRHGVLNDALLQFLPWELEVRHELAARRLPLWSDLLGGGSSPWANPVTEVASPVAWGARTLPIQHHLLGALALKLLVAVQGTWLLARRLGARSPAATVAALALALGGAMMPWALFPQTTTLAWTPWLAAATIELFRLRTGRPHTRRSMGIAALLAAIVLLSGHPEVAAAGAVFAGFAGLGVARRGLRARGFGRSLAAAGLGLLLAAPVLVPFLHLVRGSQRAAERLAAAHSPVAPSGELFQLGIGDFLRLLANPWSLGEPYAEPAHALRWVLAGTAATGVVALAGAAAALVSRPRRALPLVAFGLLGGVFLAARPDALLRLLARVPVLAVPEYDRLLLPATLSLVVAGALGLDRLLRRPRAAPVAAGAAVGAAAFLVHPTVTTALLLAGLGAAVALAHHGRRRAAVVVAGLLVVAELAPWALACLPRTPPDHFFPPSDFTRALQRESDGGTWRGIGEYFAVYPSILPVYGVPEVRPHNVLAPARYLEVLRAAFGFELSASRYFGATGNVEHPLLDFLNVGVVASDFTMPRKQRLIEVDGEFYPHRLYRNPRALPRWFVPAALEPVAEDAIAAWIADLRDPRVVAVAPADLAGWQHEPRPFRADDVAVIAARPGRVRLRVTTSTPALLATSLPEPDGWRAFAAGEELPTVRVNGAFFGARLRGGGEVELRYRPPGLLAGAVLGLAGALGVAGLLAASSRRNAAPAPLPASTA